MRKQELIQLHALCVVMRSRVEDRHDIPPDSFRSYEEYGVTPSEVYRRKELHREALFRLLDILTTIMDNRSPRSKPLSVPPEHR